MLPNPPSPLLLSALLALIFVSLSGCMEVPPVESTSSCGPDQPGPGDLRVQVVPRRDHLERSDWDQATDKRAKITPYVDNESNRYAEDETRLPAVTGPLDANDCILFPGIEPGWWEIRATAKADTPGCSWYGGDGQMVFVETGAPVSVRFQPMLACA